MSTESLKTVNERTAAEILGLSVHTIQNRRYLGMPPKFIKIGRTVRYRLSDLEEYLTKSTVEPRTDQQA